MERSEIRAQFAPRSDGPPDCAALHPGYEGNGHAVAQFSVSHTRLQSLWQVLQRAGWLKVLASCHSCASLLHCAVAWQTMSSEPQAAQTGVERAARLVDLPLDRLRPVLGDPVLSDPVLDDFERVHQLDASQHPVSIRELWESLLSKLANWLGRSIAKLRNTHVLNVVVTGGTQRRRLSSESGSLIHRTAPMTRRPVEIPTFGCRHARRPGIAAGPLRWKGNYFFLVRSVAADPVVDCWPGALSEWPFAAFF